MSKQTFIYCDQCRHCIRIDDGSYCQHYLTRGRATVNNESVTVVYKDAKGKITVPNGNPDDPKVIAYARANNLERVEYRGARATRRLEKELDAESYQRHQRWQEKRQRLFRHDKRREDLKQIVSQGVTTKVGTDGRRHTIQVSDFGRDLARVALRRMDNVSTGRYEPGNYRRD